MQINLGHFFLIKMSCRVTAVAQISICKGKIFTGQNNVSERGRGRIGNRLLLPILNYNDIPIVASAFFLNVPRIKYNLTTSFTTVSDPVRTVLFCWLLTISFPVPKSRMWFGLKSSPCCHSEIVWMHHLSVVSGTHCVKMLSFGEWSISQNIT